MKTFNLFIGIIAGVLSVISLISALCCIFTKDYLQAIFFLLLGMVNFYICTNRIENINGKRR